MLRLILWLTAALLFACCNESDKTSGGGSDSDGDSDGGSVLCERNDHSGDGTYYDADGSGNCSFPATPNDLMIAAMNQTDYRESNACGTCIHAVGPEGKVTLRIVDRCPGCPEGDVDFSPRAFELLAPLELGRIPITWTYVPCSVTGPVIYFFDPGSNQWWSSIQVRNHRNEIARFEFQDDDGTWHNLERANHNFFIYAAGMGPGPYTIRITDIHGQTLTDTNIPFNIGEEVPGATQFPDACAL
ncbi:MAG: hypothetical protein GY854_04605 [Deltaproteobacteria bacterium]|nr:hypothetical protein [Deltaproteobacteria bacterium]